MRKANRVKQAALFVIMSGCTGPALAQKAGDNLFGVGWFHLAPQDSSERLKIAGVPVPNSGASIDNADTLALTYTRMLTDNVGLTLDLGIPPAFHLSGTGSLAAYGELGSAKQWSPALLAKYYFGTPAQSLRPFIGGGISYVRYSDVKLSRSMQGALSASVSRGLSTALPSDAQLESSWAPVVNAGVMYNFNERWSATLSVSYLWLKTDADIYTRLSGGASVKSTTRLTIDPWVTLLALNYRF